MLSARNAEKDALRDEVEQLKQVKQELLQIEDEVQHLQGANDRSLRRGSEGGEKSREELEEVRSDLLLSAARQNTHLWTPTGTRRAS